MFKVSQLPHTWCQWNWDQTGSDHGPDQAMDHITDWKKKIFEKCKNQTIYKIIILII